MGTAFAPDSPVEAAYWEGISCAEAEGYLDSSSVTDILKLIYSGDKAQIKAIRKKHNLQYNSKDLPQER